MIKMKVREGCGWVLLGLLLAGCETPGSVEQFADADSSTNGHTTSATAGAPAETATKIQVGDSLTIIFADLPPPQLGPLERVVREDGTITLLHNRTFTATNKTTRELEAEIRTNYVPSLYPSMTVTVTAANNTRFYYVGGEVKRADRYVYLSRVTVLKAIDSAGGFTDFASKKRVKLTRLNGRTLTVNCVKAIQDPSLDLEVFPGDHIYVKRKIF